MEHSSSNIMYFALARILYPGNSGYYAETGGYLQNIRNSTNIHKVNITLQNIRNATNIHKVNMASIKTYEFPQTRTFYGVNYILQHV